ncbi:DUF3099 domain-containing protein [Streptomyces sp. M2CJ-2]|uniref:DUF3099 domain-containing protein n=1 Tax=Streptomyces sp. M2CJ-2 TaxID=2803948 RepID=UPI0019286B20|nr:DUF3099 domain-containing protein [Streptomyces sp. M2CJ-2]MBL3667360.1 DUF3099 domain-containing protein [Streptomyces sp. M2CJ-2]
MRKQHGGSVQVFRITGARAGLQDDVRARQRRYVISMTVRTISVILAASLWNVERHVAIVALVLGMLLPYIAVVIANAGRENAPSLPSAYLSTQMRTEIESSQTDGDTAEPGTEDAVTEPTPEPASGARTERPGPS